MSTCSFRDLCRIYVSCRRKGLGETVPMFQIWHFTTSALLPFPQANRGNALKMFRNSFQLTSSSICKRHRFSRARASAGAHENLRHLLSWGRLINSPRPEEIIRPTIQRSFKYCVYRRISNEFWARQFPFMCFKRMKCGDSKIYDNLKLKTAQEWCRGHGFELVKHSLSSGRGAWQTFHI